MEELSKFTLSKLVSEPGLKLRLSPGSQSSPLASPPAASHQEVCQESYE